ncbi:exonuclease [Jimgerdemannia flammicorona]|uniref:Exonuclease n=1 Tax=Jimgerdemannia flammicorona TaxID=994334 RepID=A0A433DMM7_9FUNG|nr:exonuclease [Jimgerdemannia flammicorona]
MPSLLRLPPPSLAPSPLRLPPSFAPSFLRLSTIPRSFTMSNSLQYLLILDFEATCENTARILPQEIIEFPVLIYDLSTDAVTATFHEYVRPVAHPKLTQFCMELTGITQDTVDAAEPFPAVWSRLHAFLASHNFINLDPTSTSTLSSFAFLTCGNWDLKTMLPAQLAYTSTVHDPSIPMTPPSHFCRWINVKQAFAECYKMKKWPRGMTDMLSQKKLELEGRHHSGIDDCKNIARIVKTMRDNGWVPRVTNR